jgi:septum formation protein
MAHAPPALRLILASASPRRLALLRERGWRPEVRPSMVEERPQPGESPTALVRRLARLKADDVAAHLAPDERAALVIGADTEVVLDGAALGKPRDAGDALRMLRMLSDREHRVLTGVCLLRGDDGRSVDGVESTAVRFHAADDGLLESYVAGGEPLGKAGGYAIQGEGRRLVRSIDGSWSNVVGLPLERLDGWLAELDLRPADFGG